MLERILRVMGWTLAHLPEGLLRGLAGALGDVLYFGFPRRRRLVLSNLHHAFADRPVRWQRAIGRESCRRLIETGLLSFALPCLPPARLRGMIRATPALAAALAAHRAGDAAGAGAGPRPTIFATAHLCYWETETAMALAVPPPFPEFGVIFRPLDNAAADAWMKRSRERFGMRLLSRKAGFQEAMKILRRNGCLGLLVDQNAGLQGALSTLFGRVCSTSELAGLLAERFRADVYALYPRRLAFWRIELDAHRIARGGAAEDATLALNRHLEAHLRSSDDACASWLWAHDRWRNQDIPARRLRLEAKRNLLEADLRGRGLATLPRQTRLWIRLPNWLGDVVMAIPLLRALRVSRPDAEITLQARPQFCPWLEQAGVADRVHPLPPPGPARFLHFRRLRHDYPDCYLLFTNSIRGDLEAWLTRCRQRFGVVRRGRPRPLLTHAWRVPDDFDETRRHQLGLWEQFLRHFGLNAPPDFTPLAFPPPGSPPATSELVTIGLICGSENDPAKRWPTVHWRAFLARASAAHPHLRFRLFGTAKDQPVADAVARDLGTPVENLAGRTDLVAFAARLRECRLLVTNDTGGMHLANAVGVPLLALFGPTNPVRTAPVFRSPVRVLQPPGCPPAGGGKLVDLSPDAVLAAVDELLSTPD
ncbi:MAG TPA: glycosyltransferase family 9 protein [Opitutaceae bacterium]|nr:glycosyltransferase family 9 protein [Opitutaceae bacterium]